MVTGAIMGIRLSLGSTLLLCGPAHLFPVHQVLIAITTKLLGSACHAGLLVFFLCHASVLGYILFALLWSRVPIILPALHRLDCFFSFRPHWGLFPCFTSRCFWYWHSCKEHHHHRQVVGWYLRPVSWSLHFSIVPFCLRFSHHRRYIPIQHHYSGLESSRCPRAGTADDRSSRISN